MSRTGIGTGSEIGGLSEGCFLFREGVAVTSVGSSSLTD